MSAHSTGISPEYFSFVISTTYNNERRPSRGEYPFPIDSAPASSQNALEFVAFLNNNAISTKGVHVFAAFQSAQQLLKI